MTERSIRRTSTPVRCPWIPLASLLLSAAILTGCAADQSRERGAADQHSNHKQHLSLHDSRLDWPTWSEFKNVVLLRDYNTRIVMLGTLILGTSAGAVGTLLLLRKRSLVGDVVSHACLPGIAIAFLSMEMVRPGSGKNLPGLLAGALLAGLLSVLCIVAIRKLTRIKEDAALAIVLSVFFGLGIALFTIIQNLPSGNLAGLHHFIFGKAASMVSEDLTLIAQAAIVVLLVCGIFFKEFTLLCFDEDFAAALGWPVIKLDLVLMGLVAVVTVIGLQSVGLLLVVALLIIPAAAARFWTDRVGRMTLVSAVLGGLGAMCGILVSALFPRLSAGAVIVLAATLFFLISLFFGARRGVIWRLLDLRRLRKRVGRLDLLRAFYECLEVELETGHVLPTESRPSATAIPDKTRPDPLANVMAAHPVTFDRLLGMRSWSSGRLRRLLVRAMRQKLIQLDAHQLYQLTPLGVREAQRIVRNHRLWETYLIHYADIAPSHVDRDADLIEHVLGPEVIEMLDDLLAEHHDAGAVPVSPHPIDAPLTRQGHSRRRSIRQKQGR